MRRKDLETLTKDELIELVLSSRKEAEEAKSERERAIAEADAKLERAYAELSKANAEVDRLLALVDAKNQTMLRDNFDRFVGKSEHSSAVRAKAPVVDEADAKAKGKPGRKKGSPSLSLTREQLAAMASSPRPATRSRIRRSPLRSRPIYAPPSTRWGCRCTATRTRWPPAGSM